MVKTEVQTFRTTKEDKDAIRELSKLYGSRSPGYFVSEMVNVIVSGDPKKTGAFLQRLAMKMGEQLTLDLQARLEAHKGRKTPKTKKGAKRRAKRP